MPRSTDSCVRPAVGDNTRLLTEPLEVYDFEDADFDPEWEVMFAGDHDLGPYEPVTVKSGDWWEYQGDGLTMKFQSEEDADEFADVIATLESRQPQLKWSPNPLWPDDPQVKHLAYWIATQKINDYWYGSIHSVHNTDVQIGCVVEDSLDEVKSEAERVLSALMLVGLNRLGRAV